MREVIFKSDKNAEKVVKSPWLRIAEAAAYCGISRSMFTEHSEDLPHGGDYRTRLYHVDVLDDWIAGQLEVPFRKGRRQARQRVMRRPVTDEEMFLVHPGTGKVY